MSLHFMLSRRRLFELKIKIIGEQGRQRQVDMKHGLTPHLYHITMTGKRSQNLAYTNTARHIYNIYLQGYISLCL
jgi:hypothetical protein